MFGTVFFSDFPDVRPLDWAAVSIYHSTETDIKELSTDILNTEELLDDLFGG